MSAWHIHDNLSSMQALPEHRIEYFKFRERVVWHKQDRVDLIFGTGSSGEAPIKIETVVATYSLWQAQRQQESSAGPTVFVDLDGCVLLCVCVRVCFCELVCVCVCVCRCVAV